LSGAEPLLDDHGRILVAAAVDYKDEPGRSGFAFARFLADR
jgi:hypothetical protein